MEQILQKTERNAKNRTLKMAKDWKRTRELKSSLFSYGEVRRD